MKKKQRRKGKKTLKWRRHKQTKIQTNSKEGQDDFMRSRTRLSEPRPLRGHLARCQDDMAKEGSDNPRMGN